jgi:23S rRNA (cytidine1920-2'-O)/16S rRNA (cytidine1409-2'-O)-methyltransferase
MQKRAMTAGTTPSASPRQDKPKQSRARLDVVLAGQTGMSRERAQSLILAGRVCVNGERVTKAGAQVPAGAILSVSDDLPYVSRGGRKLEWALDAFGWEVRGLRCLDVGASTGGFTDCLLARGAAHVVALDVGYGHLAWRLRQDPRVRAVERTNIRHADLAGLGAPFDFVCADVSFIAVAKIAHRLAEAAAPGGRIVVLVKPQFEAGRQAVQRGGVVKDPREHEAAIHSVMTAFAACGWHCTRLTASPLRGPAGNIEFLAGFQTAEQARAPDAQAPDEHVARAVDVAGVVHSAHERQAGTRR